jgi:hypothetical protein
LTPLVEKRLKNQVAKMISDKMATSIEYIKENLVNLQSQVRSQINDRKRKEGTGHHITDKKVKHPWQSHNLNPETQVREE